MTKVNLNVLFKKIQKDDKKEVLEFHVQGSELPNVTELVGMAGSISLIEIAHSEAGQIAVEYASFQRDSKKTVLKFNVKGDSEDKLLKLYPLAGSSVGLSIEPSQMSIEEFYNPEDHEGIEYKLDGAGNVEVNPDQVTMDEVAATSEPTTTGEVLEFPFSDDVDQLN